MLSKTLTKSKPKTGTRPVGFRAHKPIPKSVGGDALGSPTANSKKNSKPASSVSAAPVATNQRNAPPIKKRSKGSGFLSMLFLSAMAAAGYYVWTSLFQYEAFGVIEGRVISVAAPWDGTVSNWQVRDGETVVQGQVLAQIENIDMEHEVATLGDELKMSQATLDAEMSKIKFEVQNQSERSQIAVAEYLKSYGELLAEKAKLQELDRKFARTKRLAKSSNVSRSEYEKIFFQLAGQRKKIEKLEDAVDVLKIRSTDSNLADNDGSARLKPILAEIELTQSKITRLRERIDQGQIRAPVSGRITKRHSLTGEATRLGETVIEILEDNSVEAVLYVPQKIVDEFVVGNEIEITLEPYDQPLRCTISRFGDQFESAPKSIERFYKVNQPLLPVYLSPGVDADQVMAMRVGGTVKRPYEYSKAIGNMVEDAKSFAEKFKSNGSSIDSSTEGAEESGIAITNENPSNGETVRLGTEEVPAI